MGKVVAVAFAAALLAGCPSLTPNPQVPVCPPAQFMDDKVAEELEDVSFEGHEDFWEWISRIERLNEVLEAGC